jgi:RNA polymerase sigma-70 factor (ECF subfamily)
VEPGIMKATPRPDDTSQPITQWMAAARQGSRDALGQLLEWYRRYLLSVAEAELNPDLRAKKGAADLVQDTFLVALKRFRHFRGTTEPQLRAWLRQIVLTKLADAWRALQTDKRKAAREVPFAEVPFDELSDGLVAPDKTPSSHVRGDERREAIRRAVDQLAEEHRTVIHLVFFEHCPWEEVARRLGRTVEAVQHLRTRAMLKLEELLKGTGLLEALR